LLQERSSATSDRLPQRLARLVPLVLGQPRLIQKLRQSHRVSVAVIERPTETLAPPDFSIRGSNLQCWLDDSAIKSLMLSLPVITFDKLDDHEPQMFLSKKNHSIRSLPFE